VLRDQWLHDLVGALQLLTRLPLRALGGSAESPHLARGVWAYPLVGAAVGGAGAAAFAISIWAGVPAPVAAFLALAAMALATGALHEDGLADTIDGFGGGHDRERKLAIMRDSRIGTYGVMALIFSVGIRAGAIMALESTAHVAAALIVSGALSRAAMTVLMAALAPARDNGLSASLGQPEAKTVVAAIAIAFAMTLLAVPFSSAIVLGFALAAVIVFWRWLANRQIGGQTGDVLGALGQTAEAALLVTIAASA
jgi:adenosylcobinamide-GDP ribazoletransferase